jgi:hypothetical protein
MNAERKSPSQQQKRSANFPSNSSSPTTTTTKATALLLLASKRRSTLKLHKDFINTFFNLADCNLHFLPTVKSSDPSHILPAPLVAKQSFPTTDQLHLAFFFRQVSSDHSNKVTIIRIKHQVLMKTTFAEVKMKLKPWLIKNKAGMSGGDLIATDTCIIAWIPELHPRMVWRPDIEYHFNSKTKTHPRLQAILAEYFPNDTDIEIPPLFCNKRTIKCGGVLSKALAISCVINRATMLKELISSDNFPSKLDIIPYSFVPVCGPEHEIE